MSQRESGDTVFAIGEVVKIVGDYNKGMICFVEEIIVHPKDDFHRGRGGQYSLYGWAQPNPKAKSSSPAKVFGQHPSDWYFGDYIGKDLQTTGKIVTADELLTWANLRNMTGGYFNDLQWVLANLGKTDKTDRRSGVKML